MRWRGAWGLGLLFLLVALGPVSAAQADTPLTCECRVQAFDRAAEEADVVIRGRATELTPTNPVASSYREVGITVDRVYKGTPRDFLIVNTIRRPCGWRPGVGTDAIIFLHEDPVGTYRTSICAGNRYALKPAVDEIEGLLGPGTMPLPDPPAALADGGAAPEGVGAEPNPLVLGGLGLAGVLTYGLVLAYLRRREERAE